jgi:hypothetical protein
MIMVDQYVQLLISTLLEVRGYPKLMLAWIWSSFNSGVSIVYFSSFFYFLFAEKLDIGLQSLLILILNNNDVIGLTPTDWPAMQCTVV